MLFLNEVVINDEKWILSKNVDYKTSKMNYYYLKSRSLSQIDDIVNKIGLERSPL